jgi:hypothetical protein
MKLIEITRGDKLEVGTLLQFKDKAPLAGKQCKVIEVRGERVDVEVEGKVKRSLAIPMFFKVVAE